MKDHKLRLVLWVVGVLGGLVAIGITHGVNGSPAAAAASDHDGWTTDYAAAKAQAVAANKVMLLEFHGSDWCPPCIKLNKEVLSTPEFKAFAADKLVLVNLDFPRRTELAPELQAQNRKLAGDYGVQYFPTVILVSADGKVLGQTVGFPNGGLSGFIQFIETSLAGNGVGG
jgi:thioredoxin-related protein